MVCDIYVFPKTVLIQNVHFDTFVDKKETVFAFINL